MRKSPASLRKVYIDTIIILVVIIIINLFFGYWRSNTRRFSRQWILAIHIPVPIAIILRLAFLGWNWFFLPAFVAAFALGQFSGGQLRKILKKQSFPVSSFLAVDLFNAFRLKSGRKYPE